MRVAADYSIRFGWYNFSYMKASTLASRSEARAVPATGADARWEGLTRDDVLDNITHFWFTNSGVSASRMYWEGREAGISFFGVKGVKLPVAVSVFPDELYEAPRSWAQKAYPRLIHYNKLPKGGHFAAWEQPELMTAELRTAFRSLRGSP